MLKEKISLRKVSLQSIIITLFCHLFCCIVPFITLLAGLNVVGHVIHLYEYVFISLNIAAIGFGFYFTYFHKKKKNCDHRDCSKQNKITLWIVSIVSLFLMLILHFK